MSKDLPNSNHEFEYVEKGEGHVIILLHGLMGGLSNFDAVMEHFSKAGYKVVIPALPIFEMSIINTTVKNMVKFLQKFITHLGCDKVTLAGNSLGGHIALVYSKKYPEKVHSLILTGSSGLYEESMGDSFPRRGDYEYIKKKTEEVFYSPEVATKELVDSVFDTVNDRNKAIRTLSIAKSAIRHNMAKDLPKLNIPTCLIWGRQDAVTPPHVADDFHRLLPDSDLFWIDECGHAPMMEHPDTFNKLMHEWLDKKV